ncbi:MAG: four helix bundle protein [Prosthecobacter sp.]
MNRQGLEEQLVDFAAKVIGIVESLPCIMARRHIAGQVVGYGTNPARHYSNAHRAESRDDFIHKVKIAFRELREILDLPPNCRASRHAAYKTTKYRHR